MVSLARPVRAFLCLQLALPAKMLALNDKPLKYCFSDTGLSIGENHD
jgi:hypothetical protein